MKTHYNVSQLSNSKVSQVTQSPVAIFHCSLHEIRQAMEQGGVVLIQPSHKFNAKLIERTDTYACVEENVKITVQ